MIKTLKRFAIAILVLNILLGSSNTFAQIEEVLVTAEFREANVQETPIAITAVTADMMEARAQTNVFEVAAQAPNVTLKPGGPARSGMMAYIRGIGQSDFIAAVEPGVGIYVDDVYYAQMTSSLLDLLDLERVEILRGPQGTLAGRNSIGGAIKLYSKKPGDSDGGGQVQLGYGSFNQVDFRGSADMELLPDTLYARVAGASRNRDGYVKVLDYGCTHPGSNVKSVGLGNGCQLDEHGDQDYTTGRISLQWLATDDLEVNVIADYLNDSSGAAAGTLLWGDRTAIESAVVRNDNGTPGDPTDDTWSFQNPTISIPGKNGNPVGLRNHMFVTSGDYRPTGEPDNPYANYATRMDTGSCLLTSTGTPATVAGMPYILLNGNATAGTDSTDPLSPSFAGYSVNPNCIDVPWKPSSLPSRNTLNQWGISVQLDWQLGDVTKLTSISSYREYDSWTTWDSDYSPIPVTQLDNYLTNWQITQELRLNSSIGPLDYTVGGYFLKQNSTYEARVDLNYALIDFKHGPDPTPADTWALFANATWHATDRLNVSAGVRHSKEYKGYTHHRHDGDGSAIAADIPGNNPVIDPTFFANIRVSGLNGLEAEFEDTLTDWRLAADFAVNDDSIIYASASTGYKSGGVNPRPFFNVQLQTFDPETLTAYEFGYKSTLMDNSLRFNAAVFFNKYKDIQLTLNECAVPAFIDPDLVSAPCALPANVGNADIKGVELEAEYFITDEFLIDASWSTLDFEYTKLDPVALSAPTGIDKFDMITPYTPETQWSLGAQWGTTTQYGTVSARIDMSFQDDIFSNPTNGPLNQIDSYTLTNVRFWWRSPEDNWELAYEILNATDELYYYTKFDQASSVGQVTGTPGLPRTWRITAKRIF